MSFERTSRHGIPSTTLEGADSVTTPPWEMEIEDPDPTPSMGGSPVTDRDLVGKPWLAAGGERYAEPAEVLPTPLDPYLRWMVSHGATDLHLSPGFPPTLRVDRVFQRSNRAPVTPSDVQLLLDGLLSGARRAEYEGNRSVDLGYTLENTGRFRISCFHQHGGPAISVRHIPEEVGRVADLGLPPILDHLVDVPSGMVLFCGPTGSGKSTTQASLLRKINDEQAQHVITLEDPIEYIHHSRNSLIQQREIGEDAPNFARGLRDALREDPDVILVGELRDRETISMALAAAETGHLVFGTLHVNTTTTAVTRLLHAFAELERPLARSQIAESLRAVVNQRLLTHTSGSGLVPVVELLQVNYAVASMIRDDKVHQIQQALTTGHQDGMITFERSAAEAVLAGKLTVADARRVVPNPQSFDQMLDLMDREQKQGKNVLGRIQPIRRAAR
jgi:twitching motility protein PilT